MLDQIKAYLVNKLTNKNHIQNFVGNTSSQATMNIQAILQNLLFGLRLFHGGNRTEAVYYLKQVLNMFPQTPTYRMSAACLLGETYRGLGNFPLAEEYYELSIRESDLIPKHQRIGNEWYEHYRPRAAFGLIVVLRRTLSDEHHQIEELLQETRDQYRDFPSKDLWAQLNVVEGVYFRQLGDVSGSIKSIKSGVEHIENIIPPYLFWAPEHFEALLLISCLCSPLETIKAKKIALKILREAKGPWSNAFAYIGLIHLFFNQILGLNKELQQQFIAKKKTEVTGWFKALNASSILEKDPLITTETVILELIWNFLLDKPNRVREEFDQLIDFLNKKGTPPIRLLRYIELSSIKGILLQNNFISTQVAQDICQKGLQNLSDFQNSLKSYQLDEKYIQNAMESFSTNQVAQIQLSNWTSPYVQAFRLRLWP